MLDIRLESPYRVGDALHLGRPSHGLRAYAGHHRPVRRFTPVDMSRLKKGLHDLDREEGIGIRPGYVYSYHF